MPPLGDVRQKSYKDTWNESQHQQPVGCMSVSVSVRNVTWDMMFSLDCIVNLVTDPSRPNLPFSLSKLETSSAQRNLLTNTFSCLFILIKSPDFNQKSDVQCDTLKRAF